MGTGEPLRVLKQKVRVLDSVLKQNHSGCRTERKGGGGPGGAEEAVPTVPSGVDVAQPRAALGNGREGPATTPGLRGVNSTLPTPPWTGQAPGSLGSSRTHCLTSYLAGGPATTFKAPGQALPVPFTGSHHPLV